MPGKSLAQMSDAELEAISLRDISEEELERVAKGLSVAPSIAPRPEAPKVGLTLDPKELLSGLGAMGTGAAAGAMRGGGVPGAVIGGLSSIPAWMQGSPESAVGSAAGQALGNLIPGAGKWRGLLQGLLTTTGAKTGEAVSTEEVPNVGTGDVLATLLPAVTSGIKARIAKAAETAPAKVVAQAEKEMGAIAPKAPGQEFAAEELSGPYARQAGTPKLKITQTQAEIAALQGHLKRIPQEPLVDQKIFPAEYAEQKRAFDAARADITKRIGAKRTALANLRGAPVPPDPNDLLEKFRSGGAIAETELKDLVKTLRPEELTAFRSKSADAVLSLLNPRQAFTLGQAGGELASITDRVKNLGPDKVNTLFGNKEAYQKLLRIGDLVDRRQKEAFTSRGSLGELIRLHPVNALGLVFSHRSGQPRLLPWNRFVDFVLSPSETKVGKKMADYVMDILENPGAGTTGTSLTRALEGLLIEQTRPL